MKGKLCANKNLRNSKQKITPLLENIPKEKNKKKLGLISLENVRRSCRSHSAAKTDKLQYGEKNVTIEHSEPKSSKREQNLIKKNRRHTEPLENKFKSKSCKNKRSHSLMITKPYELRRRSVPCQIVDYKNLPVDTLTSKALFSQTNCNPDFKTPVRTSCSRKTMNKRCKKPVCVPDVSVCEIVKLSPRKLKTPMKGGKRLNPFCKETLSRKKKPLLDVGYEDDMFADSSLILASTPQQFQISDISSLSDFPTPKCNFILTPIKPKKTPRFKDIISPESYKIARKVALECMRERKKRYKTKPAKSSLRLNKSEPEKSKLDFLEVLSSVIEKEKQLEKIMNSSDEENSYFSIAGD